MSMKFISDWITGFQKGDTKKVISNSFYYSTTVGISKVSGLVLTIILARLLLPDLFGVYSLTLATLTIVGAISELGLNNALIRFISKNFLTKRRRTAGYLRYFFRIKLILLTISISLLLCSSYFLAKVYYQKPIFLALLIGSFYLLFSGLSLFIDGFLQSLNRFKDYMKKELVFNSLKLVFVPLATLLAVKATVSGEIIIALIIFTVSICWFITVLISYHAFIKKSQILKTSEQSINQKEKKSIRRFMRALSLMALAGIPFSIDTIILGRYVSSNFIGYYGLTFSLLGAVGSIISFSVALLPVFSRLRGEKIERALKKAVKTVTVLSLIIVGFLVIVGPTVVKMLYGENYSVSGSLLQFFSIWLVFYAPSAVYSSYFLSRGRIFIVAKALFVATLSNIVLNYLAITSLVSVSQKLALYGAASATILSNAIYFLWLYYSWRKIKSEKNN